jgi:methylenetetrahydrofolate dehydrogenase (NADP+)/methenyltetrahydrofolate cyclohydrolase
MTARLIDGKVLAERITAATQRELAALGGVTPGIAAILVGDDAASHTYVGLKEKACAALGISFQKEILPSTASHADVLKAVLKNNADDGIDAILVQLPLPKEVDTQAIIDAIDPEKDVDGFHPRTIEALYNGSPIVVPGLAAGVMALVHETGRTVEGNRMLIVANSEVFAKPIIHLAQNEGIFAAYAAPDAPDLRESVAAADIVVVAAGRPDLLTGDMLKQGAIVVDVGTNRKDGRFVGDAARSVWDTAAFVTPVPGGVGPVTVAMLLKNIVHLAKRHHGR